MLWMIAVMQITVTVRTLAKYKYQPKKITVALVENELEFEDFHNCERKEDVSFLKMGQPNRFVYKREQGCLVKTTLIEERGQTLKCF